MFGLLFNILILTLQHRIMYITQNQKLSLHAHRYNVNTHPIDCYLNEVTTGHGCENLVSKQLIESLSGFRSRGDPVYQDFYTMKIEGKKSGPRHLSGFEGIPVQWGSTVHMQFYQHLPILKLSIYFDLHHRLFGVSIQILGFVLKLNLKGPILHDMVWNVKDGHGSLIPIFWLYNFLKKIQFQNILCYT